MSDFIILTDSSCDLGKAMREELDVEYIMMTIACQDKEYGCSLDWEEFTPQEFYDRMRGGDQFKTSQIPISVYEENFERHLSAEKDILSLTCSSGLSGSVNASFLARDSVLKKYPGRKIFCVDTLRGSLGQGMLVYYASKLRKEGKTIEETARWIEDNRLNIHQVGTVDDLVYLKRAGRVTGLVHVMSKIFKIKPIIISDSKGQNKSVAKVRGRQTSLKKLIEFVRQHIVRPEEQTLFIVHADCLNDALALKKELTEAVGCKDVYINWVGPTVGATVGPGMIGIYFYGDKVTE